MATVGDLFRSSFRCIGQLLPGFGYASDELTDCMFVCNAMLDAWAADDLNAPWTLIQSFALTAGIGVYTVGPGGTFNGVRPTRLEKATLVVLTNPTQPLRLDLDILDATQWQSINLQLTQSTLTQKIWYNPTNTIVSPNTTGCGTANFWPVPTEADEVELTSHQPLANISGIITTDSTAFIAPPGYLDAVRYNLAVRLALEWNKPLKEGVVALAMESLAVIQRLNATTPMMDCNPGVMPISGHRTSWSRLTGD